jgi:4-amino-4-deoxy-L-arabinose transferase-like glycosyltransferase
VRFALCWLIPSWLVFEAAPTKLVHYTLPLYGALAWLMARALVEPLGPRARVAGAALFGLVALAFATLGPLAAIRLAYAPAGAWAAVTPGLFLATGALGAWIFWRGQALAAVMVAGLGGLVAHGALAGGLAPALKPLWLSSQAARALSAARANPRDGVVPGPVTVAGYAEPSLVFLLGADTELGTATDAAEALSEGRPAIVEGREAVAFQIALKAQGVTARQVGEARGLDYSKGRPDILRLYQPASPGAPMDKTP